MNAKTMKTTPAHGQTPCDNAGSHTNTHIPYPRSTQLSVNIGAVGLLEKTEAQTFTSGALHTAVRVKGDIFRPLLLPTYNRTNAHLKAKQTSTQAECGLPTFGVTARGEDGVRRSEEVGQVPGEAFHLFGCCLQCITL